MFERNEDLDEAMEDGKNTVNTFSLCMSDVTEILGK
jgi:hypothetical protein